MILDERKRKGRNRFGRVLWVDGIDSAGIDAMAGSRDYGTGIAQAENK